MKLTRKWVALFTLLFCFTSHGQNGSTITNNNDFIGRWFVDDLQYDISFTISKQTDGNLQLVVVELGSPVTITNLTTHAQRISFNKKGFDETFVLTKQHNKLVLNCDQQPPIYFSKLTKPY